MRLKYCRFLNYYSNPIDHWRCFNLQFYELKYPSRTDEQKYYRHAEYRHWIYRVSIYSIIIWNTHSEKLKWIKRFFFAGKSSSRHGGDIYTVCNSELSARSSVYLHPTGAFGNSLRVIPRSCVRVLAIRPCTYLISLLFDEILRSQIV